MPKYTLILSILFLGSLSLIVCHSAQAIGTTSRVSVNPRSELGNENSEKPVISADGRYVAFKSFASNLVSGDTNKDADIFVRDRLTNKVTRANLATDGTAVGGLRNFTLSADGRYVAFVTWKPNVTPDDTDFKFEEDVFVYDRKSGKTERVSMSSDGVGGNGNSGYDYPALSADGRFVAFVSQASNLVEGDTNKWPDIFVHDRLTHKTTRVSVTSNGSQANGFSSFPAISADGRYVVFYTFASNMILGETKIAHNIFVHDRTTGKTERVDVASNGVASNNNGTPTSTPAISGDGRYVAFSSQATNLVKGDTNRSNDIFVHDRKTRQTSRVTMGVNGRQGVCQRSSCLQTSHPTISPDGRFVSFRSDFANLIPGDTNNDSDIFIHDRITHKTERINLKSDGTQDNSSVHIYSSISADGRYVAFQSGGSLVPGKSNFKQHIFLRDRLLNNKLKADLALARTSVPSIASINSTVTYTLIVNNKGPHPATVVNLTNTVLGNGQMLSAVPSQGKCTLGSISVCRLGNLAKGKKATITLKLKVTAAGSLGNSAYVTASPVDPKPSNSAVNWAVTVQ